MYDASKRCSVDGSGRNALYLIFPLLVWLFRKCPVGTYLGMTAIGVGSAWYFSNRFYSIDQNLVVNQTLTFFSVFANGMMAAWLYMKYTKMRKKANAGRRSCRDCDGNWCCRVLFIRCA